MIFHFGKTRECWIHTTTKKSCDRKESRQFMGEEWIETNPEMEYRRNGDINPLTLAWEEERDGERGRKRKYKQSRNHFVGTWIVLEDRVVEAEHKTGPAARGKAPHLKGQSQTRLIWQVLQFSGKPEASPDRPTIPAMDLQFRITINLAAERGGGEKSSKGSAE